MMGVGVSDDLKRTVRIRRVPKVAEDERGHSVWRGTVESGEFELVSTMMLEQILESDEARQNIEKAAAEKDGYLARCTESDSFEIIEDEDLEAALASAAETPDIVRPADVTLEPLDETTEDEELSLVSTQMLRQILSDDDAGDEESQDDGGGFNPYDHS